MVGLHTAKHMGSIGVILYSDSQLVAWQLEGIYEVKSDRLLRYTEAYEKMKVEF